VNAFSPETAPCRCYSCDMAHRWLATFGGCAALLGCGSTQSSADDTAPGEPALGMWAEGQTDDADAPQEQQPDAMQLDEPQAPETPEPADHDPNDLAPAETTPPLQPDPPQDPEEQIEGDEPDSPPPFVEEKEVEIFLDPGDEPETCEAGTPGCGCSSVLFDVATRASCDMQQVADVEVDGMGYLDVEGEDHLIFAMNRWGAGHIVGWCDADSALAMMDSFGGFEYLAQTEAPRIAAMGSHWGCNLNVPYPFWANALPEQYVDNPAALAEDYDVIMFCGFHMGVDPDRVTTPANREDGWLDNVPATLTSFVKDYGKGLFVVMDYYGTVVKDYDLTHMNAIVQEAGFEFLPHELPWGDASANVALDCVPDVPPRVR